LIDVCPGLVAGRQIWKLNGCWAGGACAVPNIENQKPLTHRRLPYLARSLNPLAGALLGLASKTSRIGELPHIGTAKKYASLYRQAQCDIEGMQMPGWMVEIAVAVVVAIGLIWSVAVMAY
jgi:hypothetical protein